MVCKKKKWGFFMKKIFLSICSLVIVMLTFLGEGSVFAQEESNNELTFHLDRQDIAKEIFFYDSDGEEICLSVVALPALRARVSAGTYQVSKKAVGSWTCSYNVTINSIGKISTTSNLNLKALRGSILSSTLTHTATSATCKFKQKAGILTSSRSVTATISGNKLVVK